MTVKTVTYSMLRVTKQYENDKIEVSIELAKGDDVATAIRKAKDLCRRGLKTDPEGL